MCRACVSVLCYSVMVAGVALVTPGCGSKPAAAPTASISETPGEAANENGAAAAVSQIPGVASASKRPAPNLYPTVSLKTSLGVIKIKLDAEHAPVTVENFLDNYVSRGFYNNTLIHYVDKGMVLGGGYTPDFEAKTARAPIRSEAANGRKNVRGTLAMARMAEFPDTATSQFFFNVTDNPTFDHRGDEAAAYGYCVFGEVVEGLEILDQMAAVQVHTQNDFTNTPVKPIVIEALTRD